MMKFKIIKANIVDVASDAIVLPANEGLKEGPGSSKAIFSAAGRKELTQACKKLGHCNIGSAVPTLAYNLSSKYIIHAVVPKWIDGEFGTRTRNMLMAYQSEHGLEADGICGAATYKSIVGGE